MRPRIFRTTLLALAVAAALVGCSRDYGYSRSAFGAKFVDRSVDDAISSAGKPDATDTPDPNTVVLTYLRKTFNQENANANDAKVQVTFKKGANGVPMYSSIDFVAE